MANLKYLSSISMEEVIELLKNELLEENDKCFDLLSLMLWRQLNKLCLFNERMLDILVVKNLLNIYINEWGIPQYNFQIVFNKYNENSIDSSILKIFFQDLLF